jgi:hypothetical protein
MRIIDGYAETVTVGVISEETNTEPLPMAAVYAEELFASGVYAAVNAIDPAPSELAGTVICTLPLTRVCAPEL